MADIAALATWLDPLIAALGPSQRASLAADLARSLKTSQAQRIRANLNPDGSAYAPRKPQRARQGVIRRGAMFRKLPNLLRTTANADQAAVSFSGRAERIATVHQEGLVDQVRPGGPWAAYASRRLLGFSPDDIALIETRCIEFLNKAVGA